MNGNTAFLIFVKLALTICFPSHKPEHVTEPPVGSAVARGAVPSVLRCWSGKTFLNQSSMRSYWVYFIISHCSTFTLIYCISLASCTSQIEHKMVNFLRIIDWPCWLCFFYEPIYFPPWQALRWSIDYCCSWSNWRLRTFRENLRAAYSTCSSWCLSLGAA